MHERLSLHPNLSIEAEPTEIIHCPLNLVSPSKKKAVCNF